MKPTEIFHLVVLSLLGCGGPDKPQSTPTAQQMAPKPSSARQAAKPEGFDIQIATHAVVLEDGRVVEEGPISQLLSAPSSPVTQGLLRDATATLWRPGGRP